MALNENIRNATLTVGTTSVEVSPAVLTGEVNVRTYTNTSSGGQVIYLSWEDEAVSGKGIPLYPAGSWSESKDSSFRPSNTRVNAVATAAGGTLAIHTRMLVG